MTRAMPRLVTGSELVEADDEVAVRRGPRRGPLTGLEDLPEPGDRVLDGGVGASGAGGEGLTEVADSVGDQSAVNQREEFQSGRGEAGVAGVLRCVVGLPRGLAFLPGSQVPVNRARRAVGLGDGQGDDFDSIAGVGELGRRRRWPAAGRGCGSCFRSGRRNRRCGRRPGPSGTTATRPVWPGPASAGDRRPLCRRTGVGFAQLVEV